MSRLGNRYRTAGMTADDEIWAGVDRSDHSLVTEDDVPTGRRILAILVVYAAVLCVAVTLAL